MTTLPTLYKKTSTGAIQFWRITVSGNQIETTYGQVGTDSPQTTVDVIGEGKNLGRSNATTPEEQAQAEAEAKWTKQLKKGYVKTAKAAEAGGVDKVIEGGMNPMLAHKYKEHAKKIVFPCFGQPKLDGIRCIAVKRDGDVTLWTRTRKPIFSMPHIVQALEALPEEDFVLDGELYNHDYRYDFENIISLVRPDSPVEGYEVVQYHVYDVANAMPYSSRRQWLKAMVQKSSPASPLRFVETHAVESDKQVMPFHDLMVSKGYEGAMLRNADSPYVMKRSYDLQKVKTFETHEFPIVGFEEGRGRLAGHVGSFICEMPNGKTFSAKQKGSLKNLKQYFENPDLWKGKVLTVQYQNLTADGLPRFPVGIAIRDYE